MEVVEPVEEANGESVSTLAAKLDNAVLDGVTSSVVLSSSLVES